ncbi:hypothetical protein YC2023_021255 [Brassica napus]
MSFTAFPRIWDSGMSSPWEPHESELDWASPWTTYPVDTSSLGASLTILDASRSSNVRDLGAVNESAAAFEWRLKRLDLETDSSREMIHTRSQRGEHI